MAFSVGIGLTNECNLRCAHCYRPDMVVDRLSLQDVHAVCSAIPIKSMNLGVGENGLHPEYEAILDHLRQLALSTSITSNGLSIQTLSDEGGLVGRTLTATFNFVPRFFFARGFAKSVAPEVLDAYLAPWRDPARRTAAVIAPRQLVQASPYLREVEANPPRLSGRAALIVWGTRDFAFREAERRRFERIFPTHTTVLLDEASHFLQEDAGERIAESIRLFLRERS